MLYFPAFPDVSDDQQTTGKVYLRYEDMSQDGRVQLMAYPHATGFVVWRDLLAQHPVTTVLRKKGIIPVLTRIVISGDDGRVPVGRPLSATGGFHLARTENAGGEVERLMMNMWVDLEGIGGRTFGPKPPNHGKPVHVGRVFIEHVFTRLFAPRAERKILAFDEPGLPKVPDDVHQWRSPRETMSLPPGAVAIDDELVLDPAPVVFGLNHTDANQHVNSLVYPRMFEEAALRRFGSLGRPTALMARDGEISYRKPCFAGQTLRIALRAFELDGRLGAAGCFVSTDDATSPETLATARPHCFVRLVFAD
jgi:acyl-CoA thioesterase FadM